MFKRGVGGNEKELQKMYSSLGIIWTQENLGILEVPVCVKHCHQLGDQAIHKASMTGHRALAA